MRLITPLFILLFSFSVNSFAQENKKLVLVMQNDITNALQTKNSSNLTVDLSNFSVEEKTFFVENSLIYSQYLNVISPLDNTSNKYVINLFHTDSYKYIGRFFLSSNVDFIQTNGKEVSIYEFINLKK